MNYLPFGWSGPGLLRDELSQPIRRISARFDHPAWRGASAVTLWRFDGSGLRIQNEMHDVEPPQVELGVLTFERVTTIDEGEQVVDLGERFSTVLGIAKLTAHESGAIAESGLVITARDEVALVAGAFPLTIAVRGVEFEYPGFDPELPWDSYERSPL